MRKGPLTNQPHLVGVEATLRERPGVMLLSLLTDEAGALMLRRGEVPEYIKQQCEDALEWCGTDQRGIVRGETC
jgi:hypothetical protein